MFLREDASVGAAGNCTPGSLLVSIAFQTFFPHCCQENQMDRLSQVFLGYLKFRHDGCFFQSPEKRTEGFTGLKINWPVFDLYDDVVMKLPIERHKFIISLFS